MLLAAAGILLAAVSGQRCFTDAEIAALSIKPVDREGYDLKIIRQNWHSQIILTEMLGILFKEALGYKDDEIIFVPGTGSKFWIEFIAESDKADICMETWMYQHAQLKTYSLVDKRVENLGTCGYYGQSGYYTPNWLQTDAFRAQKGITGPFFPNYWETLTEASLIPHLKMNYTEFWMNNTKYFTDAGWEFKDLPHARFSPEWCDTANANCATFLMVMESWDTGTIQAQIRNLGLNATAEFWGFSLVGDFVPELLRLKKPFIAYTYEPSLMVARYTPQNMSRYVLPTANAYCWRDHSMLLTGLDSTVNCDYEVTDLLNIIRKTKADMRVHKDAVYMLRLSKLKQYEINALLNTYSLSSHANPQWDAACQWLKANPSTWTNWVRNSYFPKPQLNVAAGIASGFWAAFGIFMLMALIMLAIFLNARKQPQIRVISVPFMFMAWLGCVLLAVSGIFHVTPPSGMATCHLRWLLAITACVVIMGPLLAKSYRTYRIFEVDSKKISGKKVTNADVLLMVLIMYIPALIMLVVNIILTEPMGLITTEDEVTLTFQVECPVNAVSSTMLIVMSFVYVFALTYVAFISRNLPDDFNEITHMMYLSLLLLLVGGFGLAIWGFASDSPTNRAAITVFALLVCAMAVMLTLFGPKVWLILSGQAKRGIDTSSSVGSVVSQVNSVIPEGKSFA